MTQSLLVDHTEPEAPGSPTRPGPLGRIAGWSFRRRGWTVLLWLAAVAAAFGLSSAFAGTFSAPIP